MRSIGVNRAIVVVITHAVIGPKEERIGSTITIETAGWTEDIPIRCHLLRPMLGTAGHTDATLPARVLVAAPTKAVNRLPASQITAVHHFF